jgi:hypothetical protein
VPPDPDEEALDEWANADPSRMTREQALAETRRGCGRPYRMTIEFPAGKNPDMYTLLRALNAEDAKLEAEERWRRRRPHDDTIGYDIWRADWCLLRSVRVDESLSTKRAAPPTRRRSARPGSGSLLLPHLLDGQTSVGKRAQYFLL